MSETPGIGVVHRGEAAVVSVRGVIDEHFAGLPKLPEGLRAAVLDVSAVTRMTSFGVQRWLTSMMALPKGMDLYLLGCPTVFVDQLNMVLNFGGGAKVITVVAPYSCAGCGLEAGEIIDVVAERSSLMLQGPSERECGRCGHRLELDETPDSYFSFVPKYAARALSSAAGTILAELRLYAATNPHEKPPKIIKLVHGAVTYFRIIGSIGSMFRARPFLVGAEGEVVIDLAEVVRYDPLGQTEWKRLIKSLSSQVPALTLVDVNEPLLAMAGASLAIARNVTVWSVLVPYTCIECGRIASESLPLHRKESAPIDHVCPTCGGATRTTLSYEALAPLQKASAKVATESAKLIQQRSEILSRALTDANVAQAGQGATASLAMDDVILGKYKIVKRLSAGGMADVFLAMQLGIGGFEKPVALKRIQRQLLEQRHLAIDMFLNEAKIAGRLTHPNIVQVLDVDEVGGALYLAMEYVRGKDLRQIIKKLRAGKKRMTVGDACYIVREVAQALHHAYWSTDMTGKRLSVVHRDVSPHNIILSYDGAVKLLDFGVAMSSVTETSESMIVGKWQYMSPEHTTSHQIDHRSDLYSLGVILYLLTTGTMPFVGTDPKEVVKKIRAGQYIPVREAAPEIPDQLATLVERLLSAAPEERPQTGREVANQLAEIMRTLPPQPSLVAAYLDDVESSGDPSGAIEFVRSTRPSNEMESMRHSLGSGATHPAFDDSKSPSASPGLLSGSDSLHKLSGGALDISHSLARAPTELVAPHTSPSQLARSNRILWMGLAVLAAMFIIGLVFSAL